MMCCNAGVLVAVPNIASGPRLAAFGRSPAAR